MFDQHLVFLDVETTGGNVLSDRITEIGLIEVDRGRHAGEWSTLVNPRRNIPYAIQALTGITDEMVSQAPDFSDLAQSLHARLSGRLLIAHNARFDYGFLRHEFQRAGLRYASRALCTVKLSRRLDPQHARHNLDSLIERHGLACEARHRALGDARMLWSLVNRWREQHGAPALSAAAAGLLAPPVLPPGMPAAALDEIPDAPGAYVLCDGDHAPLLVGAGTNLQAGVLAHFTPGRRSSRNVEIAQRVCQVDWTETDGELSARIEEARLIRRLAPPFNRSVGRAGGAAPGPWPFRGPIAVRERGAPALIVLDQWCVLGTARSDADLHELMECSRAQQDPDVCRILARFLSSPRRGYDVVDLAAPVGGMTHRGLGARGHAVS